jgi:hypothetical protein
MRHIKEILQEGWFKSRPWLLLGTGPSLDRFDFDKYKDYNIAAVYSASDVCDRVDLHFISDHDKNCIEQYYTSKAIYAATRSTNNHYQHVYKNLLFWEYDCDVSLYQNGVKMFSEDPYPCSNTSSFAVMFLGRAGVKTIYTCGIDGGYGYSSRVNTEYIAENTGIDNDKENEGVYGHARNYGIELIRV